MFHNRFRPASGSRCIEFIRAWPDDDDGEAIHAATSPDDS